MVPDRSPLSEGFDFTGCHVVYFPSLLNVFMLMLTYMR